MAEFCLDCLRELDGINYNETEFYVSDELELCEGCGIPAGWSFPSPASCAAS